MSELFKQTTVIVETLYNRAKENKKLNRQAQR